MDVLREAVAARTTALNERIHSVTQRRPVDLFSGEERGSMPDVYPIAVWTEAKVRRDCHVQVQHNYYSVPHPFVGKTVVVRTDAEYVSVYDDLREIARHKRACGRGVTTTDRSHYPEEKRATREERRAERLLRIRAVGPGVAAFWHGLHTSRDYVHSDQVRALLRLVEAGNHADLDRACARAAHYGNFSIAALRRIIDGKLFELPYEDIPIAPSPISASTIALVRPLEAYAELIGAR